MSMYYSPSTKGFYTPGQRNTPDDAIKISAKKHAELLDKQAAGEQIVVEGGKVTTAPPKIEWDQIRRRRDKLLRESDWTQLADTPLTASVKAEFAVYRAALRNLPSDFAGPADVQWPKKPGAD